MYLKPEAFDMKIVFKYLTAKKLIFTIILDRIGSIFKLFACDLVLRKLKRARGMDL